MVDHPTEKALEEVAKVAEILNRYLAETPIGDEYGNLTEAERDLGWAFEVYLRSQGIEPFEHLTMAQRKERYDRPYEIGRYVASPDFLAVGGTFTLEVGKYRFCGVSLCEIEGKVFFDLQSATCISIRAPAADRVEIPLTFKPLPQAD